MEDKKRLRQVTNSLGKQLFQGGGARDEGEKNLKVGVDYNTDQKEPSTWGQVHTA